MYALHMPCYMTEKAGPMKESTNGAFFGCRLDGGGNVTVLEVGLCVK